MGRHHGAGPADSLDPAGPLGARAFNATATIERLTLVGGAIVDDNVVPVGQPSVSGPHPTRLTNLDMTVTWVTDRGYIVDQANYSNANSNNQPLNNWPGTDSHSTFHLKAGSYNVGANNLGQNWVMSITGLDGTIASVDLSGNPAAPYGLINTGEDFGSPGYVPSTIQQPTGDVLITEIAATTNSIYPGSNPNPPAATQTVAGGRDEFIEITNITTSPINLTGWYLQDEDGRTQPFPAGTVLQPGQAAVVIGVDTFIPEGTDQPDLQPLTGRNFTQEFYDAWGCGFPIIEVTDWYSSGGRFGLARLADNPNFINEIVRLVKADGTVADIANYDDDATPLVAAVPPFGWPNDGVAGIDVFWSIYTLPGFYTSLGNDDGRNWAASLTGFDGGLQSVVNTAVDINNYPTGIYNRSMFGTPGFVQNVTGPTTPPGDGCDPCLADYNDSGAVTVQDIFDFLAGVLQPPIREPTSTAAAA